MTTTEQAKWIAQQLRDCGFHDECDTLSCADVIDALVAEKNRLSTLADKWNFECDELREDNKRMAAENDKLTAALGQIARSCEIDTLIATVAERAAAKPPAVLMNQLVNDKLELSAKLAERDAEIERLTDRLADQKTISANWKQRAARAALGETKS